jgi:hypothetical protein
MRQGDAAISPTLLCNFVDRNRAQLLADAAAQELLCYEVWIYPASHIDNKHLQEAGGAILASTSFQGLWQAGLPWRLRFVRPALVEERACSALRQFPYKTRDRDNDAASRRADCWPRGVACRPRPSKDRCTPGLSQNLRLWRVSSQRTELSLAVRMRRRASAGYGRPRGPRGCRKQLPPSAVLSAAHDR